MMPVRLRYLLRWCAVGLLPLAWAGCEMTAPATTATPGSEVEKPALADAIRRGISEREQLDDQHALADLNQALESDPKNGDALFYRGWTKLDLGDLPGALADYNQLVELNPQYADTSLKLTDALFKRALVKQCQGDLAGALADFDQIVVGQTQSRFTQIYRQALLRRMKRPTEDVEKMSATWPAGWPKALADYVLGKITAEALLGDTQNRNSGDKCESYYFIGLKALADGDQAAARENFKMAVATRQTTYNEFSAARIELTKLDAQANPGR
jgi:lipoprotein NlpI